jgi:hypothetical protein
LQGKNCQFDLDDPLVAVVRIPVIGQRVIGRFQTEAEARSAEVAFCERDVERRRQYRESCERENARRTAEFTERVRARKLEAERRLQRSRASVVVLDRIAYHRDEFPLARPREARRPIRRRSSGPRVRRQGSTRRGPPHLTGDDEEGDPPGSRKPSLVRPSSPYWGERP